MRPVARAAIFLYLSAPLIYDGRMPEKRKTKHAQPLQMQHVEQPRAATSSIWFWLLLLALCAGGYWYYTTQQAKTEEHRVARAERIEQNRAIQAENARRMQHATQAPKTYAGAGMGSPDLSEPPPDTGETDAELAEREAREREKILAAEELQRLREAQARHDMLHPYGTEEEDPQAETDQSLLNRVPGALAQFPVFNAKVNPKAEYYIYLCSASWCGHCKKLMPNVVRDYKKMRKSRKVELILISHDKSLAEAKAYPKQLKLNCPTLWIEDMRAKVFQRLPGFEDDGSGVPHVFIVDKDGQLLTRGQGSLINQWQYFTSENYSSL